MPEVTIFLWPPELLGAHRDRFVLRFYESSSGSVNARIHSVYRIPTGNSRRGDSVPFILVVGGSTPRERFCGWVAEAGGLKILV